MIVEALGVVARPLNTLTSEIYVCLCVCRAADKYPLTEQRNGRTGQLILAPFLWLLLPLLVAEPLL